MAAIRVMIGDMSPLLRSLVEGILDEDSQFEVTSGVRRSPGFRDAPPDIDVLVISEDAMNRIVPLSAAKDALGVVAISPDGLDAAVVRLCTHRRRLDHEPRQTLSQAILDAAGLLGEAG